jgi:S-phase kinase-associated protein 1
MMSNNISSLPSGDIIKIFTSDGVTMHVEKPIALFSKSISNLLDDLGSINEPVPLPNVSSEVYQSIRSFSVLFLKNPSSLEISTSIRTREQDKFEEMPQWQTKYLNELGTEMVLQLILASNYLDIKPILDSCCKYIAKMINGKTVVEIRELFNIKNDFTPEEEEQIARENTWISDAQ